MKRDKILLNVFQLVVLGLIVLGNYLVYKYLGSVGILHSFVSSVGIALIIGSSYYYSKKNGLEPFVSNEVFEKRMKIMIIASIIGAVVITIVVLIVVYVVMYDELFESFKCLV